MTRPKRTSSRGRRRTATRAAAGVTVPAVLVLAGQAVAGAAPAAPAAPPLQHYFSRTDLTPPAFTVRTPAARETTPGSLFFTARSGGVQSGPVIMDNNGQLIWSGAPQYPGATDFRVQTYRGKPVLTFWEGHVVNGHGTTGEDVILDTSYRPVATVKAGNGVPASDLHEFQLTAQNTALITAYVPVRTDLSAVGGPKDGWVFDGVFQEIDIATGRVLFDWHSLAHVPVGDSYEGVLGSGTQQNPFDYFHINSVQKLANGDFLISSRHTHTVYRIDGHTGKQVWRLGGKYSSFLMNLGTGFDWQHNARLLNPTTLSLFDNADDNPLLPPNRAPSRALVLHLDLNAMRADLVHDYLNPGWQVSVTQGNVQVQPNGNVTVGWGAQPEITEFAPDGRILYDATFGQGRDSYRAYRFPWHATPVDSPAVIARAHENNTMRAAASWNGATEVTGWRLLAGADPAHLRAVSTAARTGFETTLTAPTAAFAQVQALGANGAVLGTSGTVRVIPQ